MLRVYLCIYCSKMQGVARMDQKAEIGPQMTDLFVKGSRG